MSFANKYLLKLVIQQKGRVVRQYISVNGQILFGFFSTVIIFQATSNCPFQLHSICRGQDVCYTIQKSFICLSELYVE